eukprot:569904-Rhodomonas_salina.1
MKYAPIASIDLHPAVQQGPDEDLAYLQMNADTSGVNLNVANSLPSANAEDAASAPAAVIALDQQELDLLEECMDTAM